MELDSKGEVHQAQVFRFLKHSQGGYDVVFLDPPFELNEWEDVMNEVGRVGLLNDGGTVITEDRFKSDLKEYYGKNFLKIIILIMKDLICLTKH